jgi:hypothetical protein
MIDPNEPAARVRHYQGQRLSAGDLQAEYDNQARLRNLHVIALHDTWGIALGFDVKIDVSRNSLIVGPGVAYDCWGRELVLSRSREISVPWPANAYSEQVGEFDLVMSYDPDISQREARLECIPCPTNGEWLGTERPAFAWHRPGTTHLGLELPLIGGLSPRPMSGGPVVPDYTVRRYTRPMTRPHMATGITPPDQRWNLLRQLVRGGQVTLGFTTNVDTSMAGFLSTPHYLANLSTGTPPMSFDDPSIPSLTPPREYAEQSPGFPPALIFTRVATAGPFGFTFQVGFAFVAPLDDDKLASIYLSLQHIPRQVAWVGVEPIAKLI